MVMLGLAAREGREEAPHVEVQGEQVGQLELETVVLGQQAMLLAEAAAEVVVVQILQPLGLVLQVPLVA